MERQARIAVAGSCNVDLTVFTPVVPRGGETVLGSEFQMNVGGKGTNQATAARRAGGAVCMITRVGEDFLAGVALAHYRSEGISTAHVRETAAAATGTATIIVDETSGENRIVVASGANACISAADVAAAEPELAQADAVLLQLEIDPLASLMAVELAKKHGKLCILNPAPAREIPERLLASADYVTPNETEAEFYTGIRISTIEDAFAAGERLTALGAACAVITLGEKGAALVRRGLRAHIPAPQVKPVDTTGAGDCFNGVLAVALAGGAEETEAVRLACAAASAAVQKKGAAASCPYREEIERMRADFYGN